jgi:hypothetical protein
MRVAMLPWRPPQRLVAYDDDRVYAADSLT